MKFELIIEFNRLETRFEGALAETIREVVCAEDDTSLELQLGNVN